MNKYVIIVAGGTGKRMQSETPKQFLNVAGKPLLMHTLSRFYAYDAEITIRLVLPGPFIDFWHSLCKRYDFTVPHAVIEGGDTRFTSVKNGLQKTKKNSLLAIHDGVRPLVSHETIRRVFDTAEQKGSAIPVLKISESIRKLEGRDRSKPANRNDFCIVQTPQCFRAETLLTAYKQAYHETFTDDASVVEAAGENIHLVEGNYENIKITRPVDLKIAEAFLK